MGIMTSDRIRQLQAMNNPAMATSIYPPVPVQEEVPQGQPFKFEPFPVDRIAEAQDMPDYAPARGAGANHSAVQSQRAFNADGSDRRLATWDELGEWNKADAVAGRKDPRSTLAWSKYGDSPEEAVEFLKRKMSADMGIESEPEEAPLPGEETLPPEVAAQNHRRSRGAPGGLRGLDGMPSLDLSAAMEDGIVTQGEINASRDRQQAATDARHSDFERTMLGQSDAERHQQILNRKPASPSPLPPADPVQEQFDLQNKAWRDYLNRHGIAPEEAPHVQWQAGPDGNKQVARGPDGKALPKADAGGRDSDRAKNRFFQTINRRYGQQIQRGGLDIGEFESIYDAAAAQGGHMAGIRAVNAAIDSPGGLRNNRDLQLQANVDRRNEQINTTQAMRDPRRGAAMFYQSLASAQTPEDQAKVLMLAHYHQPQMGWGQAAMMLQRGEMDSRAMAQWAEAQAAMREPPRPTGPQAIANDVTNQLSNIGPGTTAALQQIANQAMPGAKPEQVQAWISQQALPAVQQILRLGRPITIHEAALIRAAIPEPGYALEFAQAAGLDMNDPQVANSINGLYQQVYGKPPKFAPFRAAWNQVAGWLGGEGEQGAAQAAGK